MHPFINIAIKAARSAGNIIMRGYERLDLIKLFEKGPRNFTTNIDKAAEDEIINVLLSAYPTHSILAEESGWTKNDDEYKWIIDPLDGTTNFIHGYPHFSISIALQHKNRIEHAVIYDPLRQDIFTASHGCGSQKNNRRIRVSHQADFGKCLIASNFHIRSSKTIEQYNEPIKKIYKSCVGVRHSGSAALDLAYIASGQLDGLCEVGLHPWDMAAGVLLIKEAGGLTGDFLGGENYLTTGNVIAGNAKIFKHLLKCLANN